MFFLIWVSKAFSSQRWQYSYNSFFVSKNKTKISRLLHIIYNGWSQFSFSKSLFYRNEKNEEDELTCPKSDEYVAKLKYLWNRIKYPSPACNMILLSKVLVTIDHSPKILNEKNLEVTNS